MKIDESTFNIETYQHDWGIPIMFEAKTDDGFSIDDMVVFAFGDTRIADREYIVNTEDFAFSFALTKEEADNIFLKEIYNPIQIPYSIKRYHDGEYLETLVNATISFKGTVKWQG